MEDKITAVNHVSVSGIVASDFQVICTAHGKIYRTADIETRRLSGKTDVIPIMLPGFLVEAARDYKGQYVRAVGQYQSKNYYDKQKRRLKLYVYVKALELRAKENRCVDDNYIFLDGYICKEPIYRMTPLGRSIADLLIAVNSPYGWADYIPCICWGRTAHYADSLPVGSHVGIEGRVQSREYFKRLSDKESEKHIAYEVSVSKLKDKNIFSV